LQRSQPMVEGGNWHSTADGCHSAMFQGFPTNSPSIRIGFRIPMDGEGTHD
jgi:hypothetical protein